MLRLLVGTRAPVKGISGRAVADGVCLWVEGAWRERRPREDLLGRRGRFLGVPAKVVKVFFVDLETFPRLDGGLASAAAVCGQARRISGAAARWAVCMVYIEVTAAVKGVAEGLRSNAKDQPSPGRRVVLVPGSKLHCLHGFDGR